MKISELIKTVKPSAKIEFLNETEDSEILKITDDSRQTNTETLYCVSPQGFAFTKRAIDRGAAAVLIERRDIKHPDVAVWIPRAQDAKVRIIICEDIFETQGQLASSLYKHPTRRISLFGITGTNGKTSVACMLYHIWTELGIQAGIIGTPGVRWYQSNSDQKLMSTGYTTPRAPELQSILSEMVGDGVSHVALEVSSEGLSLGRIAGCIFTAAIFTNLSPEHLDHHKTIEEYYKAKMSLFDRTARDKGRLIVYTATPYGEKTAKTFEQKFPELLEKVDKPFVTELPIPTHFNRINASLAVQAAAENEGSFTRCIAALKKMPEIPGRFNIIPIKKGSDENGLTDGIFGVIDYAHTPDALENILREVQKLNAVVIALVFGCGGDRYKERRRLMGRIAADYCNFIIVTDDNPRTEDPAAIRKEIMTGIQEQIKMSAGTDQTATEFHEIGNRSIAIQRAVAWALKQDGKPAAVVIAGKGDEQLQIFADHSEPFSDREELKKIIKEASQSLVR